MDSVIVALLAAAVVLLGLSAGRDRASGRVAARLAALERKVQAVMDHLGVVEPQPDLPEVVAHLDQGRKIQAIRAYRDRTGADLKSAKEAVEAIARARGL